MLALGLALVLASLVKTRLKWCPERVENSGSCRQMMLLCKSPVVVMLLKLDLVYQTSCLTTLNAD